LQKKHDSTLIDIYAFFEAVEILAQKVYKDQESEYGENINQFLDAAIEFFSDFVA